MPRMISRDRFPPGGFQVLHPEVGMKQPFSGSFMECVVWETSFRKKNPSLTQSLGRGTSQNEIEIWVDEQNAIRCLASGLFNFVQMSEITSGQMEDGSKKNWRGNVVDAAKAVKSALIAYQSMFGAGGMAPVALAEERAAVCVGYPHNDNSSGLGKYLVKEAADQIMSLIKAMKDQGDTTSLDSQLGICSVCSCPLRAKVHVRMSVLQEHLPEDLWKRLPSKDPLCWMLKERTAV